MGVGPTTFSWQAECERSAGLALAPLDDVDHDRRPVPRGRLQ